MPENNVPQTVNLKPCCLKTLEEIKGVTKNIALLQNMIAASPFILMLGSSVIENIITISSNDWELYGKAVKSTNPIKRATIRRIAGSEIIKHPGGELNKFWRNIYKYA